MNSLNLNDLLGDAECIYSLAQVEQALDKMIAHISRDFSTKNPLLLGVMNGAIPTLGYMMLRLPFLLEVDYVHATRYQGKEQGSELVWKRRPQVSLQGRHIILVDDILDQGITLAAIIDVCNTAGAASVSVAVLGEKKLPQPQTLVKADYVALTIPNRYVFGFGMDYEECWRNAPGIFALKDA